MKIRFFTLGALLFTVFVGTPMSRAAESTGDASEQQDKQERIEVTGSHIKRVDVEGVSAVQTVTKEDIEKKGYDNIGDVARDLGINSFGSGTVTGNSAATPGNADIDLRGLGSDNTLVLLNGQRLPQDAVTGTVDVNLIPMAAVERIEILKDGASAVYGSDALGGVVNVITKKDFQGTQLNVTQSMPTNYLHGQKTDASVVNGINLEKLNIVTSIDFAHDQPIFSRERPWSSMNGPDFYSKSGSPGSYMDETAGATKWSASSNCPQGFVFTDSRGNTQCYFKFSDYSEEVPEITRIGGMTEGHYEVNSDLRLNARLNLVHRVAKTEAAPAPDTIEFTSTGPYTPAKWTTFNGLSGVADGHDLLVQLRTTPLGPRETTVITDSYGGLLGATFQLPKDWQMDLTTTYNLVHNNAEGRSGYVLEPTLANLISSGAYNPFAPRGSQGDISSASYKPSEFSTSLLTGLEAKASGDLAEFEAGSLGMAVGALVNYSDYTDKADDQTLAGNVIGNAGGSGSGHRSAEAFYTELSVPVVKKTVELQLAGRYDHYSDFGSTVNPKLGLLYHASPSLLFRGSVGTGFRAPLLTELYAGPSNGYQTFIDQYACDRLGGPYCKGQQYLVNGGSNPFLKQETAKSATFGVVFEPSKEFNIGTDWFYTKIDGMPGVDLHDMTVAESSGVSVSRYGVTVPRDASGAIDNSKGIAAPLLNLEGIKEAGVDITPTLTWDKFKFSSEHNQLFYWYFSGFPGIAPTNRLSENGMPRWRNTTTVAYAPSAAHNLSLAARTIPHQKTLDKTGYISRITTFDLSYVFKMKKWGDISFGAINILNTLPPYDYSNPQQLVNYSLYDPNGRQFVVSFKANIGNI